MSETLGRCAVLFPGQGAYVPGALAAVAGSEPLVSDVLSEVDRAATALGRRPVSPLLLKPGAPSLDTLVRNAPWDLHLAIFAAEVALFRLMTERLGIRPDVLVGHSFGELVALMAAGAYDVESAVRVVAARDEAFASCPPEVGGMVALNVAAPRARHLLAALADWQLCVAADNGPRQCVVSGPDAALKRMAEVAGALGIRATRLRVPYPFHSDGLAAVAHDFAARTAALPARPMRHRLYSPILCRLLDNTDAMAHAELLAAHLVRPTRFAEAVRALHADGVEVFVECGPKGTLTDLVREIVPGVTSIAPLRHRATTADFASALRNVLPAGTPRQFAPAERPDVAATTNGANAGAALSVPGVVLDVAANAVPTTNGAARPPERDELVSELRELYAETLGYPPDVLTEDADLEADLGVDSIKQTELFSRVLERHGRRLPDEGRRLTSYTTLGALAEVLPTLPQIEAGIEGGAVR